MKSKSIALCAAGAALFIAIVVTSVWFLSPAKAPELNFEQAIARIKNKEVSEILIKQDSLTTTDKSGNKYYTKIDNNDATLSIIHRAADATGTKITLEPASSGFGWILLVNTLPFYLMWAATLAVIVYAVKVLSRNKG